jgi:predicted helicase
VSGNQSQKLEKLDGVTIDAPIWQTCSSDWQAPFARPAAAEWSSFPTVVDLFPWISPGVKPNRTWVYAPNPEILRARWKRLVKAMPAEKRRLLKESRDRSIDSEVASLDRNKRSMHALRHERKPSAEPVRVSYRTLDRQWIIPDSRVIDFPRPPLWHVHGQRQIYLTMPRSQPPSHGPAITFAADIPDMHHYRGHHGGSVAPLYRDSEQTVPNVAPKLLDMLADRLSADIIAEDVLAYVAALAANPAFTARFKSDLTELEVRIPITASRGLFEEAVAIGRRILWLHTYGERLVDAEDSRPPGPPRLPDHRQPHVLSEIPNSESGMPESFNYLDDTETLYIGTGAIQPVPVNVWTYSVSGTQVVRKWLRYRMRTPAGRRSSPLDDMNPTCWSARTTTELLDLLNVIGLLIHLEPAQADLLNRILQSPLITIDELTTTSILPVPTAARRPPPVPQAGQRGFFDQP